LTEITAVPGCGALVPPLPPDEDDDSPPLPELELPEGDPEEGAGEDEDDEEEPCAVSSLSCCAKGSLLANRLNDDSWPSATGGAEADASDPSPDAVEAGAALPPSVGAARLGVPAVVVVVSLYDGVA